MKKRVWIFVCVLMLVWQTAALAESEVTASQFEDFLSQCSIEELFELRERLDSELEARGYAAGLSASYVINKNTQKFHLPGCSSVKQMKERNRGTYEGDREALISLGFSPCGNCHP